MPCTRSLVSLSVLALVLQALPAQGPVPPGPSLVSVAAPQAGPSGPAGRVPVPAPDPAGGLLAGPRSARNAEGAIWRIYDIRDLLRPGFTLGPPPTSLPLAETYARIWGSTGGQSEQVGLGPDEIVEFLREATTDTAQDIWEDALCGIQTVADRVLLQVPDSAEGKALLDTVGRVLDGLRELAAGPEIRIYVIEDPAVLERPILSPDAAEQLLGGRAPSAVLRPGARSTSIVRQGEQVAFVAEYNVEVAQESRIADPVIAVLNTGLEGHVTVRPTSDGRYLTAFGGRLVSLLALDERRTEAEWVGVIQAPTTRALVVEGAGTLSPGGALVLGMSATAIDGPSQAIAVRVVGAVAREAGRDSYALVPAGAAGFHPGSQGPLRIGKPLGSGSEGSGAEENEEETYAAGRLDEDSLLEMLRSLVSPAAWEEQGASLDVLGPWLVIRGSAPLRRDTRAALDRIQASFLASGNLEVAGFRVADAGLPALLEAVSAGSFQGPRDAVVHGIAASVVGLPFRLVAGRESAYLRDYDVEIAQKATISDPITAVLFAGLALQGTVESADPGRTVVSMEATLQRPVGDLVRFDTKSNDVGVVETPRTSLWETRERLIIERDRWSLLGVAPLSPGEALAILVRTRD